MKQVVGGSDDGIGPAVGRRLSGELVLLIARYRVLPKQTHRNEMSSGLVYTSHRHY